MYKDYNDYPVSFIQNGLNNMNYYFAKYIEYNVGRAGSLFHEPANATANYITNTFENLVNSYSNKHEVMIDPRLLSNIDLLNPASQFELPTYGMHEIPSVPEMHEPSAPEMPEPSAPEMPEPSAPEMPEPSVPEMPSENNRNRMDDLNEGVNVAKSINKAVDYGVIIKHWKK